MTTPHVIDLDGGDLTWVEHAIAGSDSPARLVDAARRRGAAGPAPSWCGSPTGGGATRSVTSRPARRW